MVSDTDLDPADLDRLPADRVVEMLLAGEARVLPAVRSSVADLAAAAELLSAAIGAGGRLVFAGAGTSGRLAAAEAAELPGTFGIAAERCVALVAGAGPTAVDDSAEDDAAAGAAGIDTLRIGRGDVVIAVAASGRTPYTLAVATAAVAAGAAVIAVVNTAGSPLGDLATVAVELVIGEEVLRGSTRLTAGTAQKIALNAMTTTAMVRAGRVHGNRMIDLVPANAKLRDRLIGIVADIASCTAAEAATALAACDDNARAAVVHLVRGVPVEEASAAAATHTSLRDALNP